MRIAMLTYHTSPTEQPGVGHAGGLNVVVAETAGALHARGNRVECYTRSSGATHEQRLANGVVVHAVAEERGARGSLVDRARMFGEELAPRLAAARVDVVHAHYWLAGLVADRVQHEIGVPFVQSFHTVQALKRDRGSREDPVREAAERTLAQHAAAVVAVSRVEAGAVLDDLGADPFRVWIAAPGVNRQVFRPLPTATARVRRVYGIEADQPILVIAGRIQSLKQQLFALEVAARVPGAVLIIAGEPTPGHERYFDVVKERMRALDIVQRVRIAGAIDQDHLAEVFSAADVTLVPSDSETFGLVALESIACGTPVVASAAVDADAVAGPWASTMVTNPPMEHDAWADAVRRVIERNADYGVVAQAVADAHSWSRTASELERVYRSVAEGPR